MPLSFAKGRIPVFAICSKYNYRGACNADEPEISNKVARESVSGNVHLRDGLGLLMNLL